MKNEDDIKRGIERYEKRIQESKEITKRNKELIFQFKRRCIINPDISSLRLLKIMCYMLRIGEMFEKDFDKTSRDDIEKWIEELNKENISENTRSDIKKLLKQFYKVTMGDDEEVPKCIRFLKTSLNHTFKKQSDIRFRDGILSLDEVDKMISQTNDIRYRLLLKIAFESGARASEILGIQLKHIDIDGEFADIQISGKTGIRTVTLRATTPLLISLLEMHPGRKNPETYLFYSNNGNGKKLSYATVSERIKEIAKKSKIKKPVNLHNFRRSSATYMSDFLNN